LEYLYHPGRLKHPLKRLAERGQDKWQQISWDEALNIVAGELTKATNNYGAESVVMMRGSAKGLQDSYLVRFANSFGTPNLVGETHVCYGPRAYGSVITHGFWPHADEEYPPACSIVWGSNNFETHYWQHERLVQALGSGTKLIVIDPRCIGLSQRADLWLQLRPGSDLALTLGMINIIIDESLYDTAFVDKWTVGFDKLKTHVRDYTPARVGDITWVDAEKIKEAARLYATSKPACIEWGNAIEHNINSFQTARAISILRAITGNLGVPGGDLQYSPLALLGRDSPELELHDKVPADKWQNRIGADLKLMPITPYVLPQSVVKAIIEEDPYLPHAAYVQGANPLLVYPNAQETYRALKKLDFLAVAEMFMTPTAALADIVLPVASFFEFDSIAASPIHSIAVAQQKVTEVGECWSDYKILSNLAKKLGLGEYFWDDQEQCLDAILEPTGLTFKEFRKIGVISGTKQYRRYEVNGFETPSRKVELYSSRLKEWGLDPLPTYYELPETPYSDPRLAKEYPLIFTSWKRSPYRHSGGRQIATLRGTHPEPVINIHPETANRLGINEGDWVYIETKRGRIKQKAALTTSIDPRVVGVDYAWWFPEKEASELYGWAESNVNVMTDDKPPYNREIGSANLRGILCKVYRVS
jgi:anaerobic selenocysteine-containing dehydrogenase